MTMTTPVSTPARDPLDEFITCALRTFDLTAEAEWLPAIKANLEVTLRFARFVNEFELPDDADPAPVFRA